MNKQLEQAVLKSTESGKKSYLRVGKCNITFGYRSGYLWIYNLETPDKFRGTGAASQALAELLEICDAHSIKLKLEAVPLDDNGDMERLVGFYARFGFKTQKQMKTATVMVRKPQHTKLVTGATCMKLEAISKHLATAGKQHVMVLAESNELDVAAVWKKIAAIFGHKPSIQIIDNEARGGHRLRVTFKKNVIDYGIWKNGIQIVDGTVNSYCVKSVADHALKLIEAENELHEKINAKSAHGAFQKKEAVKTPDGWDAALDRFIDGVQHIQDKYIEEQDFKHLQGTSVSFEDAIKFTKVFINEPRGSKRIYCFIDRNNGDILKPATYTTPAKGSRGSLFDSDHGLKRMNSHGPAYNK